MWTVFTVIDIECHVNCGHCYGHWVSCELWSLLWTLDVMWIVVIDMDIGCHVNCCHCYGHWVSWNSVTVMDIGCHKNRGHCYGHWVPCELWSLIWTLGVIWTVVTVLDIECHVNCGHWNGHLVSCELSLLWILSVMCLHCYWYWVSCELWSLLWTLGVMWTVITVMDIGCHVNCGHCCGYCVSFEHRYSGPPFNIIYIWDNCRLLNWPQHIREVLPRRKSKSQISLFFLIIIYLLVAVLDEF